MKSDKNAEVLSGYNVILEKIVKKGTRRIGHLKLNLFASWLQRIFIYDYEIEAIYRFYSTIWPKVSSKFRA